MTATVSANHRWFLPLLLLLALLQFLAPSAPFLIPLVALSAIYGLAAWWARSLRDGLSCRRRIEAPWVQVGDRLEQHFELTNHAVVPALWVEVEEGSPQAPVVRRVAATRRGDTTTWRQETIFQQRGHYHFGPLTLRSGDPFGLFTVRLSIEERFELVVHPPILDVRLPPRIVPRGTMAGHTQGRIASRQRAISASAVRSWVAGDPLSHVHWPTTARLESPYVKTFDREPSGDLWLVLDLDPHTNAGHAPESTLEYAVTLAASLAAGALRDGRAVGLAAWGERPWRLAPARGAGHLVDLLRVLAEVELARDRDGDRAPTWPAVLSQMARTVGQGSGLLLLTPSTGLEWLPAAARLRQRGLIPTVLLLDARSFGAVDAPDPQALRQALAGFGIAAEIVGRGVLPPIERRERYDFLVTGHGRVVRRERKVDEPTHVVTL